MDLAEFIAGIGAELMTRKVVSNLSFVTPQHTDSPQAVHALWPLADRPGKAIYLRAQPEGDHISVYAQLAEYHAAQEQIVKGNRPTPPGADGFFHETKIPYNMAIAVKDLVPVLEASTRMYH